MGVKTRTSQISYLRMKTFLQISATFLLVLCSFAGPTTSASSVGQRRLLEDNDVSEAFNDAKEGFTNFIDGFWGGSCTTEAQCTDYIPTCGDAGECRPSWWVWMILICLVLSLIASCICCICSCIMDCCCCCCR